MKKIVLAILDGVGVSNKKVGNAVYSADMVNFKSLIKNYPNSLINASGGHVGLPKGQMGNSEVGHLTIGAGRVVMQPLVMIDDSIKNGDFYKRENLLESFNNVNKNNSKLHIVGLLSDGGVHSSINHIFALIRAAKENNINNLYVHVITDGRDTLPNCCLKYIGKLDKYLKNNKIGKIASISGRYYAMDREENWDRVKKYYDCIVNGDNLSTVSFDTIISDSYNNGIYDEFIEPVLLDEDGVISDNDSVIVANFRPDRIVQLLKSFSDGFDKFEVCNFTNLNIITMIPVSSDIYFDSIFSHGVVKNTLGEVLANNGYKSLRIAEVSKFPHVTHFFDGDKDVIFKNTAFIKVPSSDVATFDMKPEMSSYFVTDKIIEVMEDYDFILVNYPNGDMVGHTGNFEACKKGLKAVDECIGKLYDVCLEKDYLLILLADHGNAEEMIDKLGNKLTAHTCNKVRLIVCDKRYKVVNGSLSDIAPSILNICDAYIPIDMSGKIIINK